MTVIRVAFGPGGGRLDREANEPLEPVAQVFSREEAARLSGLSPARLRRLSRALVVCPTGQLGRLDAYSFTDVAQLRVVRGLLDRGAPLADIVAAVRAARRALPHVAEPLLALRFVVEASRLVVHGPEGAFEPLTGQRLLGFEPPPCVVLELRRSAGNDRAREAYDLYLRASVLDETPAGVDEAEALYLRALALDPRLSIAYTNLGNLHHRRGDVEGATRLYDQALALDPRQPEALYNLGYLLLADRDATGSIALFLGAIEADGKFADAYFNLATALEEVGRDEEAQAQWRKYLALEPKGNWAEIARRHLRSSP